MFQGLGIYCRKEAALSHLYLALGSRQVREELVDHILRQPGEMEFNLSASSFVEVVSIRLLYSVTSD